MFPTFEVLASTLHMYDSIKALSALYGRYFCSLHLEQRRKLRHTEIKKHSYLKKKKKGGTSLVVQWLRLCAPNAGGLGSIPGQGTRSCRSQLKILHATTKVPTCHN